MTREVRLRVESVPETKLRLGDMQNTPLSIGTPFIGGMWPLYDGEYRVIPKAFDEQVLETAHKSMERNVTVEEIPYVEASNEAGGMTVSIAS